MTTAIIIWLAIILPLGIIVARSAYSCIDDATLACACGFFLALAWPVVLTGVALVLVAEYAGLVAKYAGQAFDWLFRVTILRGIR